MTDNLEQIVARVLAELKKEGLEPGAASSSNGAESVSSLSADGDLVIDLADPTEEGPRRRIGVIDPADPDGLRNLTQTTTARLAVGRAGPRPLTRSALLFQADHGVTQDAIHGVVHQEVLDKLDLFTVNSSIEDREEYLLRPDKGRRLSEEAKKTVEEKCVKNPDVKIYVVAVK